MVPTPPRAIVVAVASGKGGVGKTNLAVNLGIQFARHGIPTILLDADFGLANADILLNVAPHADICDLLDEGRNPHDLLSQTAEGLRVLCGVSGPAERGEIGALRPAQCVRAIERLADRCNLLLIDCGSGVNDAIAALALSSDRLILTTTPEPTALADAYALLKVLHQRGLRGQSGVVVNMTRSIDEGSAAARRLQRVARQFLGLPVEDLGGVPWDGHVPAAVRARTPVAVRYPRCAASVAIEAVGRRLLPRPAAGRLDPGVWSRVASLFF